MGDRSFLPLLGTKGIPLAAVKMASKPHVCVQETSSPLVERLAAEPPAGTAKSLGARGNVYDDGMSSPTVWFRCREAPSILVALSCVMNRTEHRMEES